MSRAAVSILLALAVALPRSGCSSDEKPPPTGVLVSGSLKFAGQSVGERDEDLVLWTFLIQNSANKTSTTATLRIHVTYSGATQSPADRSLSIPPMAGGDGQLFHLTTPFGGVGDYRGVAELESAGLVVARDALFFETCSLC